MKNLLPITKNPFQKERILHSYATQRSIAPPEHQTQRGFSHSLLSQFLSRLSAVEYSQVNLSEIHSRRIDEQAIRELAYFRYLERLEKGIYCSAEDDWKYAEETLKRHHSEEAV